MRARRRTHKFSFGWLSGFTFHGLLFAMGAALCLLALEMRHALGEEFAPSRDAISATRAHLGQMFADLVPEDADPRNYWASRVDQEIRSNDLASARGFLLAAPFMLDKRDSAAVTAAAAAESKGEADDRLLSAAKLFLPDDVRARYERATTPVNVAQHTESTGETTDTGTNPQDDVTSITEDVGTAAEEDTVTLAEDDPTQSRLPPEEMGNMDFFVLGSARDLAFQSAGWVRGDRTDVFSLSISGLGLVIHEGLVDGFDADPGFYEGASLVKSAIRAGRLNTRFEESLRARLDRALPADTLKANLEEAFSKNSNLLIATDVVFDAFAKSVDLERLKILAIDFERIAELADERSTTASLTLLGTVSNQRDLKRAELVSLAGGDRVIPLAKFAGADTLDAATTIMDWTMKLIGLIVLLFGITLLMGWLAVGTLLRSLHDSRSSSPPTSVPLY